MMLEDVGMSVKYPEISRVTYDEDGRSTLNMYASYMLGTRVNIENNPSMKLMMMFTVLDFFIDTIHPNLEGKSFAQKYKSLPFGCDYDLMLRELFRIAKVMRNSLVHNPSSLKFTNGSLDTYYQFKRTDFGINLSQDGLANFYTALVMYTKGDLGKGEYFLGMMRVIYKHIVDGINYFSDEFNSTIALPSQNLEIKPYVRKILVNPRYEINNNVIHFLTVQECRYDWEGVDMSINLDGKDILVPLEALTADQKIGKSELMEKWVHDSVFPQVVVGTNL
jgi:hypothetical protein